jgi:hypothetical protein
MAKAKKAKESREEPDEKDLRTPVARDGAYVMMLFVTLVAIVAGTVFMYLDHDEYGGKAAPKETTVNILPLGVAPKADSVAPKTDGGGAAAP